MKMIAVVLMMAAVVWPVAALAEDANALFSDAFKDTLAEGWSWLREEPSDWRIVDDALEIRARPGDAQSVRNALVRPVPDSGGAPQVFEVTVTFSAAPTEQYEQAGITWYADDKPVFKLVHERIDGSHFIIPGRIPTEKMTVRLRLRVDGNKFTAQFRQEGEETFQTAAEGDLNIGEKNQISLQTYHGPADADHWMRFSDFKISTLDK